MAAASREAATKAAKLFIDFANETGSPYHCVSACAKLLKESGFEELRDGGRWSLEKGGKYYVTKGGADIMAFTVGGQFQAGSGSGISMMGAHTDSPCLRLRPNTKIGAAGMLQVGVQTYGGGLWHTWFDRPLGFAGKVIIREAGTGNLQEKLVRCSKPVMIIPNLAIHLQTADERKAFAVNPESNLQPILCSAGFDEEAATKEEREKLDEMAKHDENGLLKRYHYPLIRLLSQEIGCKPFDIVDADLCLMDAQPSNLCGLYEEFISSPRIDNLISTWGLVQGLCEYVSENDAVKQSKDICLIASFDHEEVGSQSATGADGNTFPTWLDRIMEGLKVEASVRPQVYAQSFLVSADCAHGFHPNYQAKHQAEHRPEFHKGVVIKTNANQRYATTPLTAALFRQVCKQADVPVQDFVVRNDAPCGTTIGPIISSKTGIRTIDVGVSQWSMHSIRETCASADALHMVNLSKGFFKAFREIDSATASL
eukprot:TRINITY_DN50738_c0_g1_i1.p1 TRINITY_DN50738_c0_g1~~TRINITY_DN50738_c0_g1_i1.p1  ORF type:complete len:517 (-),score=75.91 TRINITY_DN50738_c0_g1_i1:126-1574(-)